MHGVMQIIRKDVKMSNSTSFLTNSKGHVNPDYIPPPNVLKRMTEEERHQYEEVRKRLIERSMRRFNELAEKYKAEKGSENITIPIHDFLVMLEALSQICDEYWAAVEVDGIYIPVENKYYEEYGWLYK